jgi:class 3 adenylate cyclase
MQAKPSRFESKHRIGSTVASFYLLDMSNSQGFKMQEIIRFGIVQRVRLMSERRVERRLVAILAADVAGYSRLTAADEEGTIARLRRLRDELIAPCIAKHQGRIVKTTGDGLLVEFTSVVDAVRCAVALQRGLAERRCAGRAAHRVPHRYQSR